MHHAEHSRSKSKTLPRLQLPRFAESFWIWLLPLDERVVPGSAYARLLSALLTVHGAPLS